MLITINLFSYKKEVSFLLSLILFFFININVSKGEDSYMIVSSNYAKFQNNPFEFVGISKDKDFKSILNIVETGFKNHLIEHFNKKELINLKIPKKYWNLPISEFLKEPKYKNFYKIDKIERKFQLSRYSLTINCNKIQHKGNHYNLWDRFYNLGKDKEKIVQELNTIEDYKKAEKALKIFDITIIRVLEKFNLLKKAIEIQQSFYNGTIGNTQKKAEFLYLKYRKADIICLQETTEEIIQLFYNDYIISENKNSAVVLLRKSLWEKEKDIYFHLEGYKNIRTAIVVAKNRNTKNRIIIASTHSDGRGQYSTAIINKIYEVINREKGLGGIPIIICHDANTSSNEEKVSKGYKSSQSKYISTFEEKGFSYVFNENKKTTYKVRTYLQPQMSKAYKLSNDKSDWILYNSIKVVDKSIINSGPNETNPTDHAILYLTFRFKKLGFF